MLRSPESDRVIKKIQLQHTCNVFNAKYISATRTSDPEEYFAVALLGRQILDTLGQLGIVEDSFDEELEYQEPDDG